MHLVIYGDFNCPYSCLASSRADALIEQGVADVEWRAIEHDPAIPRPSEPVEGDLLAMLDREVAEVSGLRQAGETFPIRRPDVHPNTAAAVATFAATAADGSRDLHELRRRLFAALWFEGRDIGDSDTLRGLGVEATLAPAALAASWRNAWSGLDRPLVPMLVLPDGYVSRGLGALARLADLTGSAG